MRNLLALLLLVASVTSNAQTPDPISDVLCTVSLDITACDSVVWNGTTYFESGTYSCSGETNSNYALSFDGVDDFIQLGNGSLLPSNSITIMTWFNS